MKFIKPIFTIIIIFFGSSMFAQEWVNKFTDPERKNFHEIREAFEKEWKGRSYERGKGFKQFKRWEWYWESRVNEDGSFPEAGVVQLAMEKYNKNQKSSGKRDELIANWVSEGPSTSNGGYSGIGRIGAIAFHPTNDDIIYVGAAGGGFWISHDGGENWETTTDHLASIGISGIVVDYSDPNIIYIATGDADSSDNYSIGVLKSTDGGYTWNPTGLDWKIPKFKLIRRLVQDVSDPNVLLAATNKGIYVTTDGGENWANKRTGNFYDLEPKPDGLGNTYYACTHTTLFVTNNKGNSWNPTKAFIGAGRTALATTAGNDSYVYALCSNDEGAGFLGLFRSTDSGSSFTTMSETPNILGWSSEGTDTEGQGWYDLIVEADPVNPNTIYVGGINTWKSEDGGGTWNLASHWVGSGGVQTVHADKHVFEWQNNILWEGNDGGVYKTKDGGVSWEHKSNGMVISQLYKLGVSQSDSKVIGGLQDNGTKLKRLNNTWRDVLGGDGMECAINPVNSDVMYGELYYGAIRRSTNGGENWEGIRPDGAEGAWVTPFEIDQNNPEHIYMGFDDIYKSTDQGDSWVEISTNLSDGNNLRYLKLAPSNSDYIYAGTRNSMWRTTDGGESWSFVSTPNGGVNMITIHEDEPNTLWLAMASYNEGEKIYKSIDGGDEWTNESGTLPNIPTNCIIYENGSENGLYVGMDVGIFYKNDNMDDWEMFSDGLPNVQITELDINYKDGYIFASTYGRGLWKSEIVDSIPSCFIPLDVVMTSAGYAKASFEWDSPLFEPSNGYEWAITTDAVEPDAGTHINSNNIEVEDLEYGTMYYFHVRSDCDNDSSKWVTYGPFTSASTCGDPLFDSGGLENEYDINEHITTLICPNVTGEQITINFKSFDVEPDYDVLYIYDGNTTNAPKISSTNGETDSGFPAGGYYGNTIPGPFTSSDTSGCLTLEFRSDDFVTAPGWEIEALCGVSCVIDTYSVVIADCENGLFNLEHDIVFESDICYYDDWSLNINGNEYDVYRNGNNYYTNGIEETDSLLTFMLCSDGGAMDCFTSVGVNPCYVPSPPCSFVSFTPTPDTTSCDENDIMMVSFDYEIESPGELGYIISINGVVFDTFQYPSIAILGIASNCDSVYNVTIQDLSSPTCTMDTILSVCCPVQDYCEVLESNLITEIVDQQISLEVYLKTEKDCSDDYDVWVNDLVFNDVTIMNDTLRLPLFVSEEDSLTVKVCNVTYPDVCVDFKVANPLLSGTENLFINQFNITVSTEKIITISNEFDSDLYIEVYNVDGRKLYNTNSVTDQNKVYINALGWTSGIYLVNIRNNKGAGTKKVFVH